MADLVQTPANVASGIPSQQTTGIAGAAITAGQPVYLNTDNKWYPAFSGGTQIQSGYLGCGIALDSAPGAGQPITVQVSGQINVGATLTIGQVYVCSANVGNIAPYSDLISTNYVTLLGVAISTSILSMPFSGPFVSGVQKP